MSTKLPRSSYEQVVSQDSSKPTYCCSIVDFTPAANATDFVSLIKTDGRLLTLSRITVNGDATGASTSDIYLFKRTTLNSGGTATAPTIIAYDSSDPSPAGIVVQYSVNPVSLGTGALIRGDHMSIPPTATPGVPLVGVVWDYGNRSAKAPKLQNQNESFCISWNGNAVPAGLSLYINIEWTEE